MTPLKVNPRDVEVRFLTMADVPALCDYFFRSPPGFIESIGLKKDAFGDEASFVGLYEKGLADLAAKGLPPKSYTVFYQGERIGMHSSTHYVPGESICMHAHFFKPTDRARGIGTVSGVKAAERFLLDHQVKRVLFKIPVQNAGPLGVIRKLGLPSQGIEVLDWPQLVRPMDAEVFSVDLEQVRAVKSRFGIE
ncbi:MAG: hypothetical protein KF767_14185 [Bdellovibrionaceae bacterium]|nr:hypothetical protein [Pseudobdellovibrionaceae bacterium]